MYTFHLLLLIRPDSGSKVDSGFAIPALRERTKYVAHKNLSLKFADVVKLRVEISLDRALRVSLAKNLRNDFTEQALGLLSFIT